MRVKTCGIVVIWQWNGRINGQQYNLPDPVLHTILVCKT